MPSHPFSRKAIRGEDVVVSTVTVLNQLLQLSVLSIALDAGVQPFVASDTKMNIGGNSGIVSATRLAAKIMLGPGLSYGYRKSP